MQFYRQPFSLLISMMLIARDLRIDFEGPAINAPGHGFGRLHPLLAEPIGDVQAAHAVMAETDNVVVRVDLLEIGGDGAHGNQDRAFDMAEGVFMGLANIDKKKLFTTVQALLHFACRDFEIVHATSPKEIPARQKITAKFARRPDG
jgi:hypothetical protein